MLSINKDDKQILQKEMAYCSSWKFWTIYHFFVVNFAEIYENGEIILKTQNPR